MKKLSYQSVLYLSAFVLLVTVNIFVLSKVILNRTGEPESLIHLTEREFWLPSIQVENTGLSLKLKWRVLTNGERYGRGSFLNSLSPVWLNEKKLSELGFDTDTYKKDKYHKELLPIDVFLVLEYDGKAYQESLDRLETAYKTDAKPALKKQLAREKTSNSRLFVIDAGKDPIELRKKYDDSSKYIITKGLIKFGYRHEFNDKYVIGYISGPSVKKINVPLAQRKVLEAILAKKHSNDTQPKYSVVLAYGHNYEPWIKEIR